MQVPARILNVDDNDGARYVKTRILQVAGFDVIEAATGGEALALVASASPDMVLLDVKLPDINGLEVCRRIKSDPATASVLVLQTSAALINRSDKIRALEGGADNYLMAPIEAEELVANVNALLRLRRTQQDLSASEERFRQMAENIEDVFWIFSPTDPSASYVSPAFASLWGRGLDTLGDDLSGWMEGVHEGDRARVGAAFARLLDGESYDEEFRIVTPGGRIRWVRDRAFRVKGTAHEVRRFARITSDISSRKMAEQLRQQEDSRKDEFLATLAHELRNPLGPIRTAVELMQVAGPAATELQERARDIISRQVDHLVHLVDDLLDISRISQGKVTLKLARIALRGFIASALETAGPLIESRRHAFEVDLPEEELWVQGDAVRLAQVVGNLLHNAAKYTPAGGRIQLQARASAGMLHISVTDNGIGIAPDSLESIFELFVQGDVAPDRAPDGLGVGLALVKKLIELHGGRVYANSAGVDMGSTFNILLPLAEPAPVAAADRMARAGSAGGARADRRRVLLVDDNPDAVELTGLLLREHGYDTAVAHDAGAAIALAQSFGPDVIVLDIGLPGVSGYEVARRLRAMEQFRSTRMVAMTGYGQVRDREEAMAAGFDRHLVKPVMLDRLLEAMGDGG